MTHFLSVHRNLKHCPRKAKHSKYTNTTAEKVASEFSDWIVIDLIYKLPGSVFSETKHIWANLSIKWQIIV